LPRTMPADQALQMGDFIMHQVEGGPEKMIRDGQEAAQGRLLAAIADNGGIQTDTEMRGAYKGAGNDLALIHGTKSYDAIVAGYGHDRNEITDSRAASAAKLDGEINLNPSAFYAEDFSKLDLTIDQRMAYTKKRDEMLGQDQTGIKADKMLADSMRSVSVAGALYTMGISERGTPAMYYQFAGALKAEIEKEVGPTGKFLGGKQLDNIVAQISARGKGTFGPTPPRFEVPETARQMIINANPGRTLSDYDIGQQYWEYVRTHGG
jgi:hypothetical protein